MHIITGVDKLKCSS